MAYTTAELVAKYTAANLGKAPDAATTLAIDAFASGTTNGGYTDAQALANTLKLVNSTTAVAVQTYQFFTGRAPSAAGLDYLVDSSTNANDLNDATGVYGKLTNQENRFINFSINLATGAGEGATAFAAAYTGVSFAQTVATAYDKIIGNAVATAAGVDVAAAVAYLSRQANIDYLTAFVKANTPLTAAADIDLAVKAALIGTILNAATVSGLGAYATATKALIEDLSDGSLSTDNSAGINLFTAYPGAGVVGSTQKLTASQDTLTGTAANDTFNALTVDAAGAGAATLTSFDVIDGGNGLDTLNIYTSNSGGNYNYALGSNITVKNIEIINILNTTGAGGYSQSTGNVEAGTFQGATQIWQKGASTSIDGLKAGQTAGFADTTGSSVTIGTAAGVTGVSIALDNAYEGSVYYVDRLGLGSSDYALNSVTLTGTQKDNNADGSINAASLRIWAGVDVTTVTVKSSVDINLEVNETNATDITAVDASGSTGAITFYGDNEIASVKTGTGADYVYLQTTTVKDNASTTTVDETISASVTTGAGKDYVYVDTGGTGTTTIDTGADADTVELGNRGTGKLTVALGAGDDKLVYDGAVISATDSIDGGDGVDTLALRFVGSANIGAFSNFERFDVVGMSTNLDIDILASKNTVTEIVASGSASTVLSNVGAGVGFRATASSSGVSLTQKAAGALTVTVDTDAGNDAGATSATVTTTATNASSLTAVFAADHGDKQANTATLNLTGSAATSLTVNSGGTNVSNTLNYTSANNAATGRDFITSITVTGDKALALDVAVGTASITSVDASTSTGGLTFNLNDMRTSTSYANVVKLGSGDDVITLGALSGAVQNVEKGSAEDLTAVNNFDTFVLTGAIQASDVAATSTHTVKDGLLTFNGAGPATLTAAIALAVTAAESANETVVFQYLGDSYIFAQGALTTSGDDVVIKLVGTTGLAGIDTVATNTLYVF